jgi:hypothetical protein
MGIATRVKERVMDDLSSPSAKRTSHWPTLVSFRVSIVVGTFFSQAATPIRRLISRRGRLAESLPVRITILTILLATHRTTPGTAAAAVEAAPW